LRFWLGGEIDVDIAEAFRVARNEVEAELNRAVLGLPLGDGVKKWYVIPMLIARNTLDYLVIRKYERRERSFEFRLPADHGAFAVASEPEKRKTIVGLVLESIASARSIRSGSFRLLGLPRCLETSAAAPPIRAARTSRRTWRSDTCGSSAARRCESRLSRMRPRILTRPSSLPLMVT